MVTNCFFQHKYSGVALLQNQCEGYGIISKTFLIFKQNSIMRFFKCCFDSFCIYYDSLNEYVIYCLSVNKFRPQPSILVSV